MADTVAFKDFMRNPVIRPTYVVSLFLLSGTSEITSNDGPYGSSAFGGSAFGGTDAVVSVGLVEHGYSSQGYTSTAADTPANTHYEARLEKPIVFGRGIELTDRLSGLMDLSGDIDIQNGDGVLDDLLSDFYADGRSIRVRVGKNEEALSLFGDLFIGRIAFSEAYTQRLVVGVSDGLVNLQKPIQTTLYQGTGGNEGGDDLAGRPKPLAFGYVFNVSPPLVDPANLIYQVHDGAIQDIPQVFDRGVSLTRVLGAPAAGQYQPDNVAGTLKLGAAPAGQITANVIGSSSPTFVSSTADIIELILTKYGGLLTSEIDASSFSLAGGAAQNDIGYWTGTDQVDITQILAELLEGIGGFAGFNRFGLFELGVVVNPSGISEYDLSTENVFAFERLPMPTGLNPAVWRVSCGYQKNYTVQNDLAASVSDDQKTFASQAFRVAPTAEDSAIKTRHLLAKEIKAGPFFRNESDASAEALRLFSLYGSRRYLYRIVLGMDGILLGFGDIVNLTFARYGLESGALGMVVGQRFDGASGQTELTVFV